MFLLHISKMLNNRFFRALNIHKCLYIILRYLIYGLLFVYWYTVNMAEKYIIRKARGCVARNDSMTSGTHWPVISFACTHKIIINYGKKSGVL